jgi:molybdate transport system regulatory protein
MNKSVELRLRLLLGPHIAIGPGKADLLQAIAETGSMAAAGRALGMSYRRTWALVDTMNRCFREPLVDTATGGRGGGGAALTPLGHDVLRRFRKMEARVMRGIEADAQGLQALLRSRPRDGPHEA